MSSPGDDDPVLRWLQNRNLDSLHACLVENGYTSVAFLVADDTLDREVLKDMGVKRGHQAPLLQAIAAEKEASTAAAAAHRYPPRDDGTPPPPPEAKEATNSAGGSPIVPGVPPAPAHLLEEDAEAATLLLSDERALVLSGGAVHTRGEGGCDTTDTVSTLPSSPVEGPRQKHLPCPRVRTLRLRCHNL
jgi:hypothetical protein